MCLKDIVCLFLCTYMCLKDTVSLFVLYSYHKQCDDLQPETGKRKVAEIVLKTPSSDKKAKIATPSGQKTG